MTDEWKTTVEIFVASATGAGIIVFIDWIVKYYLYKKKNFREAISIQIALNQMLSVSLQIRQSYNQKRAGYLKYYLDEKIPGEPNKLWLKFRHIDFPPWMNTFNVINSDWDFTQFLTGKENKVRDILNYLIPVRLGYESLMSIIKDRNEMLWRANQKLEKFNEDSSNSKNFEYSDDNLTKIIGQIADIRLRDMTDKYIETLGNVITDCYSSFNVLSEYINENFCHYSPLTLRISDAMNSVLNEALEKNKK